jgi:putative phage-type endonuclease
MGIGSSEVGTILGLNPYETPYQLWRRKKGLDAPITENNFMKAGHYLEDAVSRYYSDATGNEIIKSSSDNYLVISNERDYLRVSPDRTFWLSGLPKSGNNKGILECKTTQREVDADNLPHTWFCQLQYQLGVAELEQGALAWLVKGYDFGYKDIAFDEEFYTWMVEEVTKFWQDSIVGNLEPPLTTIDDYLLRSPKHISGKMAVADEQDVDALTELKELKAELSALEEKKKGLEELIKVSIDDAEALVNSYGQPLVTWKSSKDSVKFDEKKFKAEHPDLYANYEYVVAGSRRFLIK